MLTRGQIGIHVLPDLNAGGLRRWIVYQPLAVFLTILLAPAASWIGFGGDPNTPRPFQAFAQSSSVCGPLTQSNCVIQNYPLGPAAVDLIQLEQDAVNAYLAAHNLPSGDAHIFYDLGRTDLRDAVRGIMVTILLGAIGTPASQRTTHQQNLVNWAQGLAWADEINQYTIAINAFRSWQADPCHFTLDSTIQSTYSLSYDGNPYCFGQVLQIFDAPVPSETYFRAYGLLKSYGAPADNFTYFGNLVTGTGVNAGEIAAVALGAYAVALAAVPPAAAQLASGLEAALDVFIETGSADLSSAGGSLSVLDTFAAVGGQTASEIGGGIGTLVAAPVIIVLAAIAIGIAAGIEIFQNQQQLDDVNNDLTSALTQAQNAPPDLVAMASDTAGQGFYKLQLIVDAQTVPEVASSSALPTHQNGIDPDFILPHTGFSHTLTYQDWNKNTWTAETSGGWFVQTCVNGPDAKNNPCGEPSSISADIHFLDSNGVQWTASRLGYNFVITKKAPNFTGDQPDVGCPAVPLTGLTPTPVPPDCWTYVSSNIPSLTFGDGTTGPVTLSPYTLPGFNSPTTLSFAPGVPSTQTISAVGNPTPSICYSSGTLSGNFKLNGGSCGTGSFQIVFDGGLSAPTGTYPLTLTADGGQIVSQTFSINVATTLAVVSPNTINGTAGFPLNFQVVATGIPAPALTLDPNFAAQAPGLTLTDHHNGTGTISGAYTGLPGSNIACVNLDPKTGNSVPCGIIATNSQGSVEQATTLNMTAAPAASIPGCNSIGVCSSGATFIAGVPNQVLLTATGAITHVSWGFFNGQSPSTWLQLKDNGDGTALLSGTPPLGTTGTLTASIAPFASGSFGTADNYPVNISNVPVFTSSNTMTLTVGTFGSDGISVSAGVIGTNSTLPKGLSFHQLSSQGCTFCFASISGTAAAGTGGQYAVTLNDDAGIAGTATQYLTLNVDEAPGFSSSNLVVLFTGQPANFNVTTTGFPNIGTHQVAPNFGPPASATDGTGPYFTTSGLPTTLQASNFNSLGLRTGTLTISGTPSAADAGTHKVQISVQNGVGAPVQQTLTLQVLPYNPTTAISLLSVWTLSRDTSNNVIAAVVVANNGSQAAQNVSITSAKIGTVAGAASPSGVASIPAGSSATFRIQFPGASLGASGSSNVLNLSGTYTGGTFNNAGRIVLP